MKKEQLFRSGEFSSLPNVVMARTDLKPQAKIIYQAIASHLRNGDTWVWPSITRLKAMTGVPRRTVIRSVDSLVAAGLVERSKVAGQSTRYRFLNWCQNGTSPDGNPCQPDTSQIPQTTADPCQPDTSKGGNPCQPDTSQIPQTTANQCQAGTSKGGNQCQSGTSSGGRLVPTRHELVPGWHPKYCRSKQTTTPPYPPQAGDGGDFSGSPKSKKTENAAADPSASLGAGPSTVLGADKSRKIIAALVAKIDAAHREVFGSSLPRKWGRQISAEWRNGDRAAMEAIDAKVLRQAEAYRVSRGWKSMGHGVVVEYFTDLRRHEANADKARQLTAKACAAAEAEKNRKAVQCRTAAEKKKRVMSHFESLDEVQKSRYRSTAINKSKFTMKDRPDVVAYQAALLAWGEKQNAGASLVGAQKTESR